MPSLITRTLACAAFAAGAVAVMSAPAFAGQGQAYPAVGFPSADASCVGTALDYGAHYGDEGDTFPVVTHGAIGPAVSGHATSDGPGAVGDFNSGLARSHGPVWTCLP
jgi:hypothetical protein